jgi:bifunctional DNA-binding transcriptional regulator/antitoxin component of YhaV-PrlF toxin-antitoxin module
MPGGTVEQVIEVTVDETGDIVIPAAVSGPLGLSPGTTLIAEEADEGGVRLRIQSELPMLVAKGGVLVVRAEPVGDVASAVKRERKRHVSDLAEP